jgi:hypothetical protein
MIKRLYQYRFEMFLSSQVAILFGSLFVPAAFFDAVLNPLLFLVNLLAGVLLVSKKPLLMKFCLVLLATCALVFALSIAIDGYTKELGFIRMVGYFLFYVVIALETIRQVWLSVEVNKNVIFGLITGYISLGLIGFFMFFTIEWIYPSSFRSVLVEIAVQSHLTADELLYFSFITLMTIGYGDILPMTSLAQKAAVLVGLLGQFYLVIITAVVVGKFINQKTKLG